KTSIFSHPVYLFLREFSLQDFRGGSIRQEARSDNPLHRNEPGRNGKPE
ncbi:integrase, partial [Escherichia coli]